MKANRLFVGGLTLFIIGFFFIIPCPYLKPVEYQLNNEVYLIHRGIIFTIFALIPMVYGMVLINRTVKLERDFESLFGSKPPHTKWEKEKMQRKIDKIARENIYSVEWIRKTAEAFGYVVKG